LDEEHWLPHVETSLELTEDEVHIILAAYRTRLRYRRRRDAQ